MSWFSSKTWVTQLRENGFTEFVKSFRRIPESRDLHEVVELTIKVHIVGSRVKFKWPKAREKASGIAGYATRDNDIYVIGKRLGGKIVLNQGILGHELNHLLNFKNDNIADPDKLDDLGG